MAIVVFIPEYDRHVVEVRARWREMGGFRPPVLEIDVWSPEDGDGSATLQLSGDEIGRLRQVLNHTPQKEVN